MSISDEAIQLHIVQTELSDLKNRYDDLKMQYENLEKDCNKLKNEKSHHSDNQISNTIQNNNKRLEKLLRLAKMNNNSNSNTKLPNYTYNFSCTSSQVDLIVEENESDSSYSNLTSPIYVFADINCERKMNDENIPILSQKSSSNTILSIESSKSSTKPHKKLVTFTGLWMKDEEITRCSKCCKSFSFNRRRHHCRICGLIFCAKCCNNYRNIPGLGFKQRICEDCHNIPESTLQDNYNSLYVM